MADQAAVESVGQKLDQWAQGLPENEQEALAEWMQRSGGDEVSGYEANWWQGENAWQTAWNASWSEWSE